MKYKILIIFAIAFFIRLIALNQSLWLDEATTARVVQQYSYSEIVTKFSPTDFHPPLYYLFMKSWTNIFGHSEITLRMPSVFFSLATGYVIYLIAGIWASMFFLFNPLIIYYSQEARMYMMATFLLTTGLYYFFKSQKLEVKSQKLKSKFKSVLMMNLFFALAFFSFYGSIFLIAAMFIYLLYKKQYKFLIVSLLIFIVSLLLISTLFYQQLLNAKTSMPNVANWTLVLGKANIKNLLLIPIKFSIGRIDFYPKWIYYFISGIWTLFVFFSLFKNLKLKIKNSLKTVHPVRENFKLKILLTYLFIFPLILGFVVSFFTPLLQYFRFLYLIPIMSILLTANLSNLASFNLRGWILALGFIVFSLVYLLIPQFHREDWKSLVKSLPNDKPVYMIVSSSDPVKYYNHNLTIKELKDSRINELEKQITVIPYTAEIHGVDYQKILQGKNYRLVDKKSFRGLITEEYSKQ